MLIEKIVTDLYIQIKHKYIHKMMQKWDFKTREYKDYIIPVERYCPLVMMDMEQIVNCASCWKKLEYWLTFTSMAIHNQMWFWYGVCEECYNIERQLRKINWQ